MTPEIVKHDRQRLDGNNGRKWQPRVFARNTSNTNYPKHSFIISYRVGSLKKKWKQIFFPNRISIFIFISMQNNVDFVNSAINNYHIDCFTIQNVQVSLNKEMKVDG